MWTYIITALFLGLGVGFEIARRLIDTIVERQLGESNGLYQTKSGAIYQVRRVG